MRKRQNAHSITSVPRSMFMPHTKPISPDAFGVNSIATQKDAAFKSIEDSLQARASPWATRGRATNSLPMSSRWSGYRQPTPRRPLLRVDDYGPEKPIGTPPGARTRGMVPPSITRSGGNTASAPSRSAFSKAARASAT